MAPSPEPQPSRRRWFPAIAVWIIVGAVIGLGAIVWHLTAEERVARKIEANERWLKETIIPTLDWRQVTLEDAVAELNRLIEQTPGHPSGLRIVIASDEESHSSFRRRIPSTAPGEEPLPKASRTFTSQDSVNISRLSNVPVSEVLRYVAKHFGRQWRVERRGVVAYPRDEFEGTYAPLVSKTFYVSRLVRGVPDFLESQNAQDAPLDATDFLMFCRVIFYEGCAAEFDAKYENVRVVLPQEQMDRIESEVAWAGNDPSWFNTARLRVTSWLPGGSNFPLTPTPPPPLYRPPPVLSYPQSANFNETADSRYNPLLPPLEPGPFSPDSTYFPPARLTPPSVLKRQPKRAEK